MNLIRKLLLRWLMPKPATITLELTAAEPVQLPPDPAKFNDEDIALIDEYNRLGQLLSETLPRHTVH